jgi:hypothetical protein
MQFYLIHRGNVTRFLNQTVEDGWS